MTNYIYIMDRGDARKIGFSKNPDARRAQLQAESDNPVHLVAAFETDNPRDCERAAHKRLADHRLDGEWFDVSVSEAETAISWALENPVPIATNQRVWRFTEFEIGLLDALKAKHGTYNAGIIAAARTELGIDETDWPAALRRLAQILEDDGA